jgi:hypothetical protein
LDRPSASKNPANLLVQTPCAGFLFHCYSHPTCDATGPADLPDWMLALLEGEGPEELSHELITAASLIYIRRLRPGISLDTARVLLAEYAVDPARLAELSGRITAFRLACCFERLKRAGRFEDVFIGDPFDPESDVSVKLTESEWRSVNGYHEPPEDPDRR